ncbi:glycoside hydrolase family 3 N-terminal domain-containing protein [Parachryseolinea silvisoli]|uniref:glycoside hydrolase family 3 N-terminal domain-containing protein n=1 Tax=Parachryseolinea silvisoli TaxID=2873601 RepID=UPI002265EA97|nr:glycoside hydrolase family 3 N-terminal domain-containing protein [Parachryseolinea silvisoli]MCD9015024.1 glycoside hydrolase family 3 C-terminal domain-containing protein [Parachryseolinea silvisoli]
MYLYSKRKMLSITGLSVMLLFVFQAQAPVRPRTIQDTVEALLAKMTLEEKVGQMAQVTLDVITKGPNEYVSDEPLQLDPALVKKALVQYHVGSVLNTANNRARTPEKWYEIISQLQNVATKETRLKIPLLYGIDAVHGATYTAGATFFPQQIGQAAMWNRALVRRGAEICAYETRASSIPWAFAPVLDMGRDARFPRLWETFGEDVYLVSALGKEMVDGLEGEDNNVAGSRRVASCLKHFLGYQVPQSGKDRTPAFIPETELRERHLPSFKAAIDAGAKSIMINSGIINGISVHANHDILTKLLKEELGFKGVVVTDWKDIDNLHERDKVAATPKEAVKLAINAGIDMSMIPYNFRFCDYLVELVKEGQVPMTRIDDAVRRILTLKFELDLFKTPVTSFKNYPEFGSKAFEQSAYDAAGESITLLKNTNNILPLKKGAKLLVTGPNANSMRSLNGGWSYSWQGEKVSEFADRYNTILEALQKKAGSDAVKFVPGVSYKDDGKYWQEKDVNIDAAVQAAAGVDYVILCAGENSYTEKPGDLHDLSLSANQVALAQALVKTGKPVILVLNEGRPRLISAFEKDVQAVVQTYLPGNFGGDALAAILFGEINPSGKLPYTYPMYANTLVTYDHKPSEEQNKMQGMYDYESDFAIQYPFGFGLSYTTFEYSDLQVDKAVLNPEESFTVSVTVKNTGARAGKEVIQLFTSDLYASMTPDVKRLRGFDKILLTPGQSQKVTFTVKARDLAFVNKDLRWTVEAGDYEVSIGTLKTKIQLSKTHAFAN